MKNNIYSRIILLTIIGCGFLLAACSSAKEKTPEADEQLIEDFAPVVSATGVVNPARKSTISVSTTGIVAEVLVEKGDIVKKGQTLLRLEGQERIQASITQAKMELISAQQGLDQLYEDQDIVLAASLQAYYIANNAVKEAQYQLDNFTIPITQKGLSAIDGVEAMNERLAIARKAFEPYKNDSITNDTREELKDRLDEAQADYNAAVKRLTYEFTLEEAQANLDKAKRDYDTLVQGPDPDLLAVAEARLENAKAALAAAEKLMDDLEINALFDGTVSDVFVRDGEWVAPGQPIALLADLKNLRVETTDLNEIDVARVQVGDSVTVTFDALSNVTIDGKVTLISPKASEGSGVNYTVLIELQEIPASLRWGMTAFVDIHIQE